MMISSDEIVVSILLAIVSTIACIIALEVLLYYKMWRMFIYRLVLYMFTSLIIFNLCEIIFLSIELQLQSTKSKLIGSTDFNSGFNVTLNIFCNGSMVICFHACDLYKVCIYLMELSTTTSSHINNNDLCMHKL